VGGERAAARVTPGGQLRRRVRWREVALHLDVGNARPVRQRQGERLRAVEDEGLVAVVRINAVGIDQQRRLAAILGLAISRASRGRTNLARVIAPFRLTSMVVRQTSSSMSRLLCSLS